MVEAVIRGRCTIRFVKQWLEPYKWACQRHFGQIRRKEDKTCPCSTATLSPLVTVCIIVGQKTYDCNMHRTEAPKSTKTGSNRGRINRGSAPYNFPGAAFAFSVVWRNGTSTTVWTGQCLVREDGHETLLTSWLLRSTVKTCIDKWKSTMIGRDTFTRYEQLHGPRKPDEGKTEGQTEIDKIIHSFDPDVKNKPCNLNGKWYNVLGSEMILKQRLKDNVIEGEYRTAVERETGAAGNSHSKVFGIGQLGGSSSTFSFFVVWNNGSSVTGWVGQCHICGENKTAIIESTWLLRSKIGALIDNWKSTLYSEDSFTRTETTPGPRKSDNTHTPDRSGDEPPKACKGCHPLFSFALLGLSVLVSLLL